MPQNAKTCRLPGLCHRPRNTITVCLGRILSKYHTLFESAYPQRCFSGNLISAVMCSNFSFKRGSQCDVIATNNSQFSNDFMWRSIDDVEHLDSELVLLFLTFNMTLMSRFFLTHNFINCLHWHL